MNSKLTAKSIWEDIKARHIEKRPLKVSDLKDGLDGVEFLRDAVKWLDHRNEHRNGEQTPQQLLNAFFKAKYS